jgi:hypothetical protein
MEMMPACIFDTPMLRIMPPAMMVWRSKIGSGGRYRHLMGKVVWDRDNKGLMGNVSDGQYDTAQPARFPSHAMYLSDGDTNTIVRPTGAETSKSTESASAWRWTPTLGLRSESDVAGRWKLEQDTLETICG